MPDQPLEPNEPQKTTESLDSDKPTEQLLGDDSKDATVSEEPDKDKSLLDPPDPAELTAEALKLPEGMSADDESVSTFLGTLNRHIKGELDATEFANSLLEMQAGLAQKSAQAMDEAWTKQQDDWVAEVRKNEEFGGKNLDASVASIRRFINSQMGDGAKDVFTALSMTGAGNHPAIFGLLHKAAAALNERSLLAPEAGATGGATTNEDRAAKIYTSMRN